jgi:hypothetical protein
VDLYRAEIDLAACSDGHYIACDLWPPKTQVCCAQDIAELEAAVAENMLPLEAVGAPHRALRAFRALLFAAAPAAGESLLLAALPRSTVLHHLYSRAPPALQSPHSRSGFSPAQVPSPALQWANWAN